MVAVIAQHGGNDSGRAIGRRGDDAPARRVLLVDRHGVDADEIHDLVRRVKVALGRLHETIMDRPGATHELQAAGQRPGLREAPVDAGEHHVEDALDMGVDRAFRPERRLVRPHQLGDREPVFAPARQKLGPGAKGIGQARFGRGGVRARAVADDEPAADREPRLVGERPALRVARDEPHGVGMARRGRQRVERNGALGIEGDEPAPGEVEPLRLAHPRHERVGQVRIDGLGRFAAEAQDCGLVGRVAFSREGERAKQRDLDRGDLIDGARPDEAGRERGCGLHRPNGMGR